MKIIKAILLLTTCLNSISPLFALSNQSRFWSFECQINNCEEAFKAASTDAQCYGKKLCSAIVFEYFPKCSKCVEQILKDENHELIDGTIYPICDSQNSMQVQGCLFYCRSMYSPSGQCVREFNMPLCKCVSDATTVAATVTNSMTTTTDAATTTRALVTLPEQETLYTHLKHAFKAHIKAVECMTLLTNGDLVSGSWYETKVWSQSDYSEKKILTNYNGIVYSLVALPNGLLASGSNDKTIKIWDPVKGEPLNTLVGHEGTVQALTVLPNGHLVSGSFDKTIKIWDVNGTLVRTLEGHKLGINALAVLPNGDLVSGSSDSSIKIWNTSDGTIKNSFSLIFETFNTIAVLSDNKIATGTSGNDIRIYNLDTGRNEQLLRGHSKKVKTLVKLPNGVLASGSADSTIRIWDLTTYELMETFEHDGTVTSLVVMPNGDLVSSSTENTVKVWSKSKTNSSN